MGGEKIPALKDGTSYTDWKKKVRIWEMGTDVKVQHRAAKLVMHMGGKPEEVAIQLDPTQLGAEGGVKVLLDELDKLYEEDKTQSIFQAIDSFNSYRRPRSASIDEYIREFQQRYKSICQLRDKTSLYDDGILAYLLLNQANLDNEQQRLIRATISDLTYANMEKALKRTYGENLSSSSSSSSLSSGKSYTFKSEPSKIIKDEPVFYQEMSNNTGQVLYPNESQQFDKTDDIYYQDDMYFDSENDVSAANEPDPEEHIFVNGSYYQKYPKTPFKFQNQRFGNGHQFRPYQPQNSMRHQFNKGFQRPQFVNNQNFPRAQSVENGKKKRPCYICSSEDHWFKDCPHNTYHQKTKSTSSSKMTFFKSDFTLDEEESTFLIGETTNKALLDTGASSTVCGKTWFKIYEESLTEKEKSEIQSEKGLKSFKFGDGEAVMALEKKTIPISICGNDMLLTVHVVENDVPLLLSRESMKRMKLIIDMEADKVYMGDGEEDLQITKSGHVVLPIGRCGDKFPEKTLEIESTFYINTDDSKKCASHLHRYFAHSSANKLKPFIKSANLTNGKEIVETLEKLDKTCEFCLKHKSRVKPHRKVGIPQGTIFNEVVAMDLKKLKCGTWIVHFIDTVTRFSVASRIENKSAEEILTKTFQNWIAILGRPTKFMSDNGGEFVNTEFNNMCSLLNIEVQTSPAESPWCNGTVERHNGLLAQMIEAIMDDTGCNIDTAIAWAMNAKNSLNNVFGFSPYQLVMGRNPEVPDILSYNNLPALNSYTASQITADHLNAMETARKKFIELENNSRFKRVMQERVTEANEVRYISGDIVYFKKQKTGWQGPAIVVGQVANQVLLKHGGMLIRMHPCKVVLKSKSDNEVEQTQQRQRQRSSEDQRQRSYEDQRQRQRSSEDQRLAKDPSRVSSNHRRFSSSSSSSSSDSEIPAKMPDDRTEVTENILPCADENPKSNDSYPETEERTTKTPSETITIGQMDNDNEKEWTKVSEHGSVSKVALKKGDIIRYQESQGADWEKGLVMSRAGKASGKYKNTFNILKDGTQDQTQVDIDQVALEKLSSEVNDQVMLIEEDAEIFVINSPEDPKVTKAKEAEIQKFKEFDVYKEVKDVGQPTISTRWVITNKGETVKARLVARGFEELSYTQCDAPTVTKPCLRMAFFIASSNGWKIESLDITSAFLQSDEILREVFIKPPPDVRTAGVIWLLNKPLYGLGESARLWYLTLKKQLLQLGCKMSMLDKSVFLYFGNSNKLQGMVVTHVDDLFYCGGTSFKKNIIQPILSKFKISRMKTGVFTYLGWSVCQEDEYISVDQNEYTKLIKPIPISPSRKKSLDADLTTEEHKQYQSLLGKLLWLSSQTRPDLSYDTMEHSTIGKNTKVKDLISINKVTKKVNEGHKEIVFRSMNLEKDRLQIVFYSDASLGNLPDKKSSGRGYLIFVTNGVVTVPISWSSNKIKRVVHSVFGAETLGCVDGAAAAINVRQQLSEILFNNPRAEIIPIVGLVDSRQLSDQIVSTTQCQDKRVRLDIAELQESVSSGEIDRITWIPTSVMLADSLTKKGACTKTLCDAMETGYIIGLEDHLAVNG